MLERRNKCFYLWNGIDKMKISPIISNNCIYKPVTNSVFKGTGTYYYDTDYDDIFCYENPDYDKETSAYIRAGIACIAVLGSAALISNAMKRYNKPPMKMVKNSITKITNKIKPHLSEGEKLEQRLSGRRDSKAVEIYDKFVAENKLKSLQNKYFKGEFRDKPEVIPYILENARRLREVSCSAL